ncbi:MAG: small subunit ribosomal protein S9 [Candidatus Paceibacteria bacterium]|jgi:small subunit ribosomal protein S9
MADSKYIEGIGRRKTASARVRLTQSDKTTIVVNEKKLEDYFPVLSHQKDIMSVLETEDAGIENYTITAKVFGGGTSSQAEAIRLGIARSLVKEKAERRGVLKALGFLKRDPRSVERKKPGLRKARKRAAWSKR